MRYLSAAAKKRQEDAFFPAYYQSSLATYGGQKKGGYMRHLNRIGKWLLVAIVFMALGFTGRTATALQVFESGDAFLDIDYQVQARQAQSSIDENGNSNKTNNFYLRRDRLSFLGAANDTYQFALQLEYDGGQKINETAVSKHASDYRLTLLDAYLQGDYGEAFKFRAGRTKHLLTREVSEGCFDPLSMDRSTFVSGPFTPTDRQNAWSEEKRTRDVGFTALGNLFDNVFQYRFGIMQGNNYSDAIKPDEIGYRYTGRVHVSLLDPESNFGYKGTYLGKKKVLTFGAGYEIQPKAVYKTYDTTLGGHGWQNYQGYTYDFYFEYPTEMGTPTLSAAYLKQDFGEAGERGVPGAADGEKNGYYVKAAYMLGKFQVYARFEKWSFASLSGVIGQEVKWSAEGINYYIKGEDLRLTLEAQKTDFQIQSGTPDFRTIIVQLQARI